MKQGPREAVIWLAVHHKQKEAVEIFSREIASAGTGMGKYSHHLLRILKLLFFFSPGITNTQRLSCVQFHCTVCSEIVIFLKVFIFIVEMGTTDISKIIKREFWKSAFLFLWNSLSFCCCYCPFLPVFIRLCFPTHGFSDVQQCHILFYCAIKTQ